MMLDVIVHKSGYEIIRVIISGLHPHFDGIIQLFGQAFEVLQHQNVFFDHKFVQSSAVDQDWKFGTVIIWQQFKGIILLDS